NKCRLSVLERQLSLCLAALPASAWKHPASNRTSWLDEYLKTSLIPCECQAILFQDASPSDCCPISVRLPLPAAQHLHCGTSQAFLRAAASLFHRWQFRQTSRARSQTCIQTVPLFSLTLFLPLP